MIFFCLEELLPPRLQLREFLLFLELLFTFFFSKKEPEVIFFLLLKLLRFVAFSFSSLLLQKFIIVINGINGLNECKVEEVKKRNMGKSTKIMQKKYAEK